MVDPLSLILSFSAFVFAGVGLFWYHRDRKDIREGISKGSDAIVEMKDKILSVDIEHRLEGIVEDAVEKYGPRVEAVLSTRVEGVKADMLTEMDTRVISWTTEMIPRLEEYGNTLVVNVVGGFEAIINNLVSQKTSEVAQGLSETAGTMRTEVAEAKALRGMENLGARALVKQLSQGRVPDVLVDKGFDYVNKEFGLEDSDILQIGAQGLQYHQSRKSTDNGGDAPSKPATGGYG